MKYRITVEVIRENQDSTYDKYDEVYQQIKEDIDILAVISAVNAVNK